MPKKHYFDGFGNNVTVEVENLKEENERLKLELAKMEKKSTRKPKRPRFIHKKV